MDILQHEQTSTFLERAAFIFIPGSYCNATFIPRPGVDDGELHGSGVAGGGLAALLPVNTGPSSNPTSTLQVISVAALRRVNFYVGMAESDVDGYQLRIRPGGFGDSGLGQQQMTLELWAASRRNLFRMRDPVQHPLTGILRAWRICETRFHPSLAGFALDQEHFLTQVLIGSTSLLGIWPDYLETLFPSVNRTLENLRSTLKNHLRDSTQIEIQVTSRSAMIPLQATLTCYKRGRESERDVGVHVNILCQVTSLDPICGRGLAASVSPESLHISASIGTFYSPYLFELPERRIDSIHDLKMLMSKLPQALNEACEFVTGHEDSILQILEH